MVTQQTTDVAVAVIVNDRDEALISYRHAGLHQGDRWEFPGGKFEAGETVEAALRRELREELGLEILRCHPFTTVEHQYPDKSVRLHVWRITQWEGLPRGLEGQKISWRPIASLQSADFPVANAPIIKLLQLPAMIAITPQVASLALLEAAMERIVDSGVRLVQLRQPQLDATTYLHWFRHTLPRCQAANILLVFNGAVADFSASGGIAYHANASRLLTMTHRPVAADVLFSASCHDQQELQQAAAVGADFVTLSPVKPTASHPATPALGWDGFEALAGRACLPVYGLGGLEAADLPAARQAGAHGICGIRLFQVS